MGWSSGSYLAEDIWEKINQYIIEENKKQVAETIYNLFCCYDADDWTNEEGSLKNIAEG